MRCGHCTAEIPESAIFCPHCGERVEGREECTDYHYEAFISYRHRDIDRKVAKRLQRRLEGYRIPRHITTERSERRLGKLFRDQDELPTSSSLSAQIEDALLHSRRLIVVCSPESRASAWVQREVEMFSALHGRRSILLAIAEGEPDECFPPLLLQRVEVAEDGMRSLADEEPLAADFRDMRRKAFSGESMRIAAALIGCGYDDLRQRQRQRTARLAGLAAAVVSTVSVAFGGYSLYQEAHIKHEHELAQIHESEMLAVEAERLLERGDRYQAVNVALSALPEGGKSEGGRPIVPAAQLMLQRAIGAYPSESNWTANYSLALEPTAPVGSSKHCIMATTSGQGGVDVIDLVLGNVYRHIDVATSAGEGAGRDATVRDLAFSEQGLVVLYGGAMLSFDPSSGEVLWRLDGEVQVLGMVVGENVVSALLVDDLTASTYSHIKLVMCDAKDGKVLQSYDLDDLSFALDDARVFIPNKTGDTVLLSVSGMQKAYRFDADGSSCSVSLSGDMGLDFVVKDDVWYVLNGESTYGKGFVEAFDSSGKRLWTYSNTSFSSVDRLGTVDSVNDFIVEVENRGTIVATFSTILVELDPKTGEELNRADFDKPVLDCTFEGNVCFGMLSDGRVFYQPIDNFFSSREFFYDDLTTDDLSTVRFLRCDGFGMFILVRTSAPEKLVVFKLGDGIVATAIQKDAQGLSADTKVWWEGGMLCFEGSDSVGFLSGETFEPLVRVPKDQFPSIDWTKSAFVRPLDGGALIGGPTKDNADDLALYRITDAGEIEAEVVLDAALDGIDAQSLADKYGKLLSLDPDGNPLWYTGRTARLLDRESLEVAGTYAMGEGWAIDDVCCGRDTVLLFGHEGKGARRGHPVLLSREYGERIVGDLDDYAFFLPPLTFGDMRSGYYWLFVANRVVWTLSPDAQSVALACADGVTRVFDLSDGSLEFEAKEIPPQPNFLGYVPGSGDILVQDERGICALASGKDGALLASTMTTLRPIKSCLWVEGVGMLARYQQSVLTGGEGIVLLSVSKDAFGPFLDIPGAVAFSDRHTHFLTSRDQSYSIYPIVVLEVSTSIATELVKEHPLSDAEAAYYQVDREFQGLADVPVKDWPNQLAPLAGLGQ